MLQVYFMFLYPHLLAPFQVPHVETSAEPEAVQCDRCQFETIEHGDGAKTTVRWRPDGDTGIIECGVMSVVESINNALSIGVIKTAVNVNLLMNVV